MVSSIYTAQNNGIMRSIWKFMSNITFIFVTSIVIIFILILINKFLFIDLLNLLKLSVIDNKPYNFIINIFIYIFIPLYILNFYLFFYKNKYKSLIVIYKSNYNKKLFLIYYIISHIFLIMSLILHK
jgi:hypothetical protein